jgi:hypothetical protein
LGSHPPEIRKPSGSGAAAAKLCGTWCRVSGFGFRVSGFGYGFWFLV